jgi:predicted double-glycine peptidase
MGLGILFRAGPLEFRAMAERWILFAFGIAVLTASLFIGLRASRIGPRAATAVIVLCLVPVLARATLLVFPGLEFRFLCHDGYALLRPWWSVPFAIALFTTASPHMTSRLSRSGLLGLSLILWISGTDRLLATARFDPASMDGEIDEDGVCRQTTDYTCGAAAAATLLHPYGVRSDEREMAEYCWTNSLTGTDELCVARGLRRKLAGTGLEPRIDLATWDDLVAWGAPAAVTVKYKLFVDHWVVVLAIEGERVLIGDPIDGRIVLDRESFLEMWRGRMVTLRPALLPPSAALVR